MRFTRRSFLKGAAASIVLASAHVLSFARPARSADVDDPVLVLVNLRGGNDALNTVIPLDDVGAPQRSVYQSLRPDLAIPTNLLGATEIAPDPDLGTRLALHPNLPGLKALFDQGRLALVNGVGIDGSSLSHFEAEEVWYSGNPAGLGGTGWVGRHLDTLFNDGLPRAISFGQGVNASLPGLLNDAIGARSVDRFGLPEGEGDLAARRHAWDEIFAEARLPGTLASRAARSGEILLSTADTLSQVETSGWGSYNDNQYGLGEDLRDVASILRHDALDPGNASGLCFFHVGAGGFDTHSQQGTIATNTGHGQLMDGLDRGLYNFQSDLEQIGVAQRVITLGYSEFGRRTYQNDSGGRAGTDHGRGGMMFLMGDPVEGGVHGRVPELNDPDEDGNLRVLIDFRSVYAAVIDDWLGGDHTAILPGGPFTSLPVIT